MATRLVLVLIVLLFAAGVVFATCERRGAVETVAEDAGPPSPVVVTRVERGEQLHLVVPHDEIAPERYCAIGERRPCGGAPMSLISGGPFMYCMEYSDGSFRFNRSTCNTPLVVSFDGRPVAFTSAPAAFHVGIDDRTEWVSASTPWLALDRDGSGCIEGERELFAGFAPLAELDDNHDGVIDAHDRVFGALVLWSDANQDKRCSPGELVSLDAAGITSLELAHVTPGVDAPGSHEGETSMVHMRSGINARLIDVYLAPAADVH